jgi:Zn-dependent M28 family amino/carboxypeptidase
VTGSVCGEPARPGGPVGSTDYVTGLTQAERDRIAPYMDYDMVGSPNGIFSESVNGVPGETVPGRPVHLPEPAGPEGTFAEEAGGRLHLGAAA